ncbi:MAG: hypothetical protein QG594_1198, partial [Bacteroidota bacterium]|nr:hypothetical protein [Bacteroidota bacterium]
KKVLAELRTLKFNSIDDLKINKIITKSFFLDRGSDQTLMKVYIKKNYLYLYFSGNISKTYSNGPYIICSENVEDSQFFIKYYIKKLERKENGELKLCISTRNSILFSRYDITINYISELNYNLIRDSIL